MLRGALRRMRTARATRDWLSAAALRGRARATRGEGFESRIIWMFGSPRSGSSWLLALLAEHEAVVPVDEPLIGWYLGPFLSDLPGVSASKVDPGEFTLRRLQRNAPSQFFSEEFSDVWVPALRRLMRERFRAQAIRYPASVPILRSFVVIKEPNGSQSADVIMRALPASRLLFLLRDGRDVVDSEVAAATKGSWVGDLGRGFEGISDSQRLEFVVGSAYKWLWRTQVVQTTFAQHRGAKLLVRYEDLLREPVARLRGVFDWLGLSVDESRLSALVERHEFDQLPEETTGLLKFHRAATPGLWRQNLLEEEQAALDRILGPKLRELGYDV